MIKFTKLDEKYMRLAIKEAKKGIGKVDPNPLVGCVIVKNGVILSTGYHHCYGKEHAEVDAISKLSMEELENSSLYITLEPCNHFGKTPPCTDLIIKSKIKNVFIGCIDSNPLVCNSGIKRLKENNINVYCGLLENECKWLNRKFFYAIQNHIPYILAKFGMSIDGKIATKTKDSKWITNQKSREISNSLRNEYMGIMVGVNTIIADNPQLNTRVNFIRNPIRIILDTNLKIPLNSFVIEDAKNTKTIIFTSSSDNVKIDLIQQKHVDVYIVPKISEHQLDLKQCLQKCYKLNINSILVEGGSQILGSCFEQNLVNEIMCFIGDIVIGGQNALTPIGGKGIDFIANSEKYNLVQYRIINDKKTCSKNIMLNYIKEN